MVETTLKEGAQIIPRSWIFYFQNSFFIDSPSSQSNKKKKMNVTSAQKGPLMTQVPLVLLNESYQEKQNKHTSMFLRTEIGS